MPKTKDDVVYRMPVEKVVALLRENAFKVEDPESSDHGRTLIHSRLSGIGADQDVEDAITLARRSSWCGWVQSFLGHNLGVEVDGRLYCFAVALPEPGK